MDDCRSDLIIGLGLLGFCSFATWQTALVRVPPSSSIAGPTFLPWLMIAGIAALSVALVLRAMQREHGGAVELPDRRGLAKVGAFAALLVVYASAFMPLGYLVSTLAACIAGLWLFGERRIAMLTVFPLILVGAVYLGFTEVLRVWLP